VVCTHPHNLQPMEMYAFTDPHTGKKKQWFVIYSVGDFVSYDTFPRSHLWAIIQLRLKKMKTAVKLSWVQLLPFYMQQSTKGSEMSWRLLHLERLAAAIKQENIPQYIDNPSRKEALCLYDLLHTHLLPDQL
jgi:poly-gamma-glutamate capsule biosynthesis protein CapA/YwtB (metallophosphatase superfamily)